MIGSGLFNRLLSWRKGSGKTGLYLFGVMKVLLKASKDLCVVRVDGTQTFPVFHQGLAAVVAQMSQSCLEATPERILWHSKVLEQIMQRGSVLPLSFGTVARRRSEVEALLRCGYPTFQEVLEELAGKVEFDVEAHWNPEVAFKRIAEESPRIQEFKETLAAKGGGVTAQEQIAAGRMVAEDLARKALLVEEEIRKALVEKAQACVPLKRPKKETLVTNLGFLVHQGQQESFEKAIYALGDRYGDLLKFKYAGPFPPYSFTRLEISLVDEKELAKARSLLGLSGEFSMNDLQDAYRRLSLRTHPDQHAGDPKAEESFKEVVRSYELLMQYGELYGYPFRSRNLKGAPVFLVRRTSEAPG